MQGSELTTVFMIVQNCMALDECCTSCILAREANRCSLHQQSAKGQELRETPVNRGMTSRHFLTLLAQLLKLGMHSEIRREIHVGITDTLECLGADCRRPANHHSRAGKLAFGDLPLIVLRVVFLLRRPTVFAGVLKDLAELSLVGAD